jgi:hypothetical protein
MRPDFQANTRQRFLFKVNNTARYRKTGNLGIVLIIQFLVNGVGTALGQESPLMKKKGLKIRPVLTFASPALMMVRCQILKKNRIFQNTML